jgi:hypothetical protein
LANNEGEEKEAIHPELACIPIPNIRTMSLKFTIIGRAHPLPPSPQALTKAKSNSFGGGGTNRQPLFDNMYHWKAIVLVEKGAFEVVFVMFRLQCRCN